MQFLSIATMTGLLASTALAANCFSQSGCQQCENSGSLNAFADNFCNRNNGNNGFTTWGWASAISSDGEFQNSGECETAFNDIIEQCLGNSDGGDYENFSRLQVSFCNCESA